MVEVQTWMVRAPTCKDGLIFDLTSGVDPGGFQLEQFDMPLGVQHAIKSRGGSSMWKQNEVVLFKVENKDAIEMIPAFDQMARGLSHLLLSYERGTVFFFCRVGSCKPSKVRETWKAL